MQKASGCGCLHSPASSPLLSSVSPLGMNVVVRCLQSGIVNVLLYMLVGCFEMGLCAAFPHPTQRRMEMSKNGCVLRQLSIVASWFGGDGNVVSVVYDFGKETYTADKSGK